MVVKSPQTCLLTSSANAIIAEPMLLKSGITGPKASENSSTVGSVCTTAKRAKIHSFRFEFLIHLIMEQKGAKHCFILQLIKQCNSYHSLASEPLDKEKTENYSPNQGKCRMGAKVENSRNWNFKEDPKTKLSSCSFLEQPLWKLHCTGLLRIAKNERARESL
ncbi:hypothetical protein VNO77_25979 [Canavalia gladiata]|uniref:Uncharacterized protein n=1 Tax=Canavalia gladiata TaxID=3824 RepID=A0AAN9KSZ4_CANGL